ncbi:MAG: MmgE/PrpD family protein [Variovorax sp.]|nr:MmgE/PrpD family protein [Variovorax sp.]
MSLAREFVSALQGLRRAIGEAQRAGSCLRIADSVGIGFGATAGEDTALQVAEALATGSAGGVCGIFGQERRETPAAAAFANSALVHVLDFDDIHDAARLHPTTVTLPAALAAAQLAGASGASVVDAVLLGDELMCRLGVACAPKGTGPGSDWFLTQLFGYFGGALAAGLVLGLSNDQLVSAFGLAYMQAAGGKQAGFGTGATARAIYPAFAAMGGVQACLLARAGVRGPEGALDGAAGLFPVYFGAQATPAQRELLLQTGPWHADAIQLKPWPSCRLSHPYVAAALALRGEFGEAQPVRIEAHVNASAAKLCRPLAERRCPATLQDAKYSIPWMIAFTLVHGRVDLSVLGPASLADERVLDLAQRVEVLETLPDRPGHPPARIRVRTGDGRDLESPAEIERVADGMGEDVARSKFDACLAYAGLEPAQSQALWMRLLALTREPRVDFLFDAAARR